MKEQSIFRNQQEFIYMNGFKIYEYIVINLMGKKQKKVVEEVDSEEGANSAVKEGDKKQQYFECKCGKKYGSLAAVHTHINNKHAQDKKAFKQSIKNPKKNGQGPSTSIRMKDINYNEQQADLMCVADTTVKNIFDFIKKYDEETRQNTHFLLDQNAIDSSEELDEDEDIDVEPRLNGFRDNEINQKLKAIKEKYNIIFLNTIIKDAPQFEVFKLNKFNLTMIRELTKFFNPSFASKIQLQLEIIAAKSKIGDRETVEKLYDVQKQIWGDKIKICEILEQYFNTWKNLRGKQYKSNVSLK